MIFSLCMKAVYFQLQSAEVHQGYAFPVREESHINEAEIVFLPEDYLCSIELGFRIAVFC